MKIRKGFVSNSSTASFIVKIKERSSLQTEDFDFLVNKKDIPKLEQYGFIKSNLRSPFYKEDTIVNSKDPDNYTSMKYYVTCNFEEQVCFLVKNNIPFKAACHYDNKYISYKKDSDYIFEAINYGIILDMYGEDFYEYFDTIDNTVPFRKIPIKEYLEKNE